MGFAYRCDKCHQLTEKQIVLCPSCALNAKEAGQPDAQQLKLEIAALATDLEYHLYSQFSEQMYRELRKRMRQLSSN